MAFQKRNGNGKEPYHHKTNRGSLFENDNKKTEKHPDFTGSIDVEGVIYWLSGWKAMTEDGRKRLSVAVTKQEERRDDDRPTQQPPRKQSSGW